MKKHIAVRALIIVAGMGMIAGNALAMPLTTALQKELDDRTQGGKSSINVSKDMLEDGSDAYWRITATGASASTLIFKFGGYAPTTSFGIYDQADPNNTLLIFDASITPGNFDSIKLTKNLGNVFSTTQKVIIDGEEYEKTIKKEFSSDTFGYYFAVGTTGKTWYSDTNLNSDQFDHMFAYQGTGDAFSINKDNNYKTWTANEYILAWEDMTGGGDKNYRDFAVMVESVQPVPEPAAMLLFGAGITGLAAVSRRKIA
ncbi:MAG: DUF4114 domain-containing protein [Desulfobulbus sp.]|jgi:hypothetical protein